MNPQLGAALQNPQIRSMLSNPNVLRQMADPAVLQVGNLRTHARTYTLLHLHALTL